MIYFKIVNDYNQLKKGEKMEITPNGWSNKKGTAVRACSCGTWQQHWLNFSGKTWPALCSVQGCNNVPILGAHIRNPNVEGEKIVPMCSSCNGFDSTFNLKCGVTFVSANTSVTCEN